MFLIPFAIPTPIPNNNCHLAGRNINPQATIATWKKNVMTTCWMQNERWSQPIINSKRWTFFLIMSEYLSIGDR